MRSSRNALIGKLKRKIAQATHKSPLYNLSLNGAIPDRLVVKPVDPWPGNPEKGRWLCEGMFVMDGEHATLEADCWEPVGVDMVWLEHMHGFEWLRDLRAHANSGAGEHARREGRAMIGNWAQAHKNWKALPWRGDITGKRLVMWISHYDCFAAGAAENFNDIFFESMIRQARHLSRTLPGDLNGIALLEAARGLLYAGMGFEGHEAWIEQALEIFVVEIDRQILNDGAHVSRSSAQLLQAMQILLDIRTALSAGGYPPPEEIQHALDRMAPALRFYRYPDNHFGLFNGAQEESHLSVDNVLAQMGSSGKALESLPCVGYEKVHLGRSMLMFDCGAPPEWPFDDVAHAAPLAFEFAYGKDRLFVNCGAHPVSRDWNEALRATPAHNTLTIDNRNAYEIRNDGHFGRKARTVTALREESKSACLLEATHDGYLPLNGIVHKRRLYLSEQGNDLRGEDLLSCSVGLTHPCDIAIRFHLHPRATVSLVRDDKEALIRLPGGVGWRFHHAGGILKLETSIYLGEGARPRKTKQLVIYGRMVDDSAQIKWALQREG